MHQKRGLIYPFPIFMFCMLHRIRCTSLKQLSIYMKWLKSDDLVHKFDVYMKLLDQILHLIYQM